MAFVHGRLTRTVADTLYADVSEWQVGVNDTYPYPVLCIRSNDGTYRDLLRVIDDITLPPGLTPAAHSFAGAVLGDIAATVRDKRIPLELCPSSNVQTGAVPSLAEHPFNILARLRFRVTVNTDNRLMSDTSMSNEFKVLVDHFGYGWADLERFTVNAMKSSFLHFDERIRIIDEVIKPRFAVLIG